MLKVLAVWAWFIFFALKLLVLYYVNDNYMLNTLSIFFKFRVRRVFLLLIFSMEHCVQSIRDR
ncbi:hypothetical protein B9Q16_09360 [Pantoea ananatis]|nr:hypothetical protein B9Q16_09360 [Pantoea ananatis]